jgi:hypothetical protein
MGVVLCLRRVSAGELQRLKRTPRLIRPFLLGEPPSRPKGLLSGLFGRRRDDAQEVAEARERAWASGDEIDLDKAWHIVHFLLTGTADKVPAPAGALLNDSQPITKEDICLGPPWALLPAEAKKFAAIVAALTPDEVEQRLDLAAMKSAKVYLAEEMRDIQELRSYALHHLAALRSFMATASDNDQGVILFAS